VLDHRAGVAGEHLEQVPLGGRELDVLVAGGNSSGGSAGGIAPPVFLTPS
jgi:hypothetical protein